MTKPSLKPPLTKKEIEKLILDTKEFADQCFKYDSLFRGQAWLNIMFRLANALEEEKLAGFKLPSKHNPNKKWVLDELKRRSR